MYICVRIYIVCLFLVLIINFKGCSIIRKQTFYFALYLHKLKSNKNEK